MSTSCEIGQRVSGEGHIIGDSSRNVRAGRFHLDPDTRGVGVNRPGAFAEYLVIPAFNVIPLPDSISLEIGAILDPLGNAVHSVLSFDVIGEDVLITGAGPDWHDGGCAGALRQSPPHRADRYQPISSGARPAESRISAP